MRFIKVSLLHAVLVLASLFSTLDTARAGISYVFGKSVKLTKTTGTTSFYQGITWQGTTRSVLFIQPTNPLPGKAPAIVLLHYDMGTPELMGNLSRIGTLAASMGYWIILPPAINGHWHDDPSDTSTTTDDVGFLSTVIQTATSQYPIDSTRVSMAGMSNGGFMTTRMACQASQLIASAVVVAAEMRASMAKICQPVRPVPMIFVMGSADTVVPFNGDMLFVSAQNSFGNWMGFNACNTGQTSTQALATTVNDGTSITLQHNAACTSLGEADFYTVVNGGHDWPGGNYTYCWPIGIATKNLDATAMIGSFVQRWTTASTV